MAMGSLDKAAGSAQKALSIVMGGALLAFVGFGIIAKAPSWYANRKAEAARNAGPGLELNKMRGGGPAPYLTTETDVEYPPNAKIIRTKVTQHEVKSGRP